MERIEEKECDVIINDELEPCGDDTLFQSEEEMRRCLSRLCYGDLYIIGSIWIELLKTVLVGSKFSLFPVVEAAKPPEPPTRPPKMKYKDLPVYQSPHYEYKDYVADKGGCANRNTKLIQQALYPRVRIWRKQWRDLCASICCNIRHTIKDMKDSINSSKNDFKKTMRDPAKLEMRQGVLAGGTAVGYFLGGGGGVPKRAFFTSLGALTAGALCFPKETDEIFRDASFRTAKTFLALYNGLCKKTYALRERVPCKDELKPDPPYRKPLDCPKKK